MQYLKAFGAYVTVVSTRSNGADWKQRHMVASEWMRCSCRNRYKMELCVSGITRRNKLGRKPSISCSLDTVILDLSEKRQCQYVGGRIQHPTIRNDLPGR